MQRAREALEAAGLDPSSLVMHTEVFHVTTGGEKMASDMGVPFLGRVPLDPAVSRAGEQGRCDLDIAHSALAPVCAHSHPCMCLGEIRAHICA